MFLNSTSNSPPLPRCSSLQYHCTEPDSLSRPAFQLKEILELINLRPHQTEELHHWKIEMPEELGRLSSDADVYLAVKYMLQQALTIWKEKDHDATKLLIVRRSNYGKIRISISWRSTSHGHSAAECHYDEAGKIKSLLRSVGGTTGHDFLGGYGASFWIELPLTAVYLESRTDRAAA